MNCVILQPSYIPWRGLFHQVQKADLFVFYDDVQYDDRGWRNRNRIKTATGSQWLTIPVHSKGCQSEQKEIRSISVCADQPWQRMHWGAIERSYRKAPFFDRYAPMVQSFYTRNVERLATFTMETTVELARSLGIVDTRFAVSSELNVTGTKTERLLSIMKAVQADHYISGPSAKSYMDEELLLRAGITVEYMSYDYPEYRQLFAPFDPSVSVLDLLFMTGPDAGDYIWNNPGAGRGA